jgi:hypothetical protein
MVFILTINVDTVPANTAFAVNESGRVSIYCEIFTCLSRVTRVSLSIGGRSLEEPTIRSLISSRNASTIRVFDDSGGRRRSNQLNSDAHGWWALSDLNGRPFGCKPNALTAELSALTHLIVPEAFGMVNERRKSRRF